jgi:hypothetical protein
MLRAEKAAVNVKGDDKPPNASKAQLRLCSLARPI